MFQRYEPPRSLDARHRALALAAESASASSAACTDDRWTSFEGGDRDVVAAADVGCGEVHPVAVDVVRVAWRFDHRDAVVALGRRVVDVAEGDHQAGDHRPRNATDLAAALTHRLVALRLGCVAQQGGFSRTQLARSRRPARRPCVQARQSRLRRFWGHETDRSGSHSAEEPDHLHACGCSRPATRQTLLQCRAWSNDDGLRRGADGRRSDCRTGGADLLRDAPGHRRPEPAARTSARRPPRPRPRAARVRPGLAKTLAAETLARRRRRLVRPHPVHARPLAIRHRRHADLPRQQ